MAYPTRESATGSPTPSENERTGQYADDSMKKVQDSEQKPNPNGDHPHANGNHVQTDEMKKHPHGHLGRK